MSRGAGLIRRSFASAQRWRTLMLSLFGVSGLSIASSGVGFLFQIVLAARFGTGAPIECYLFSISVPMFLAALATAALSYTIVPALVRVETVAGARSALLRAIRRRIALLAVGFALVGLPAIWLQPLLLPADSGLHALATLPLMILLGWAIGGVQIYTALYTIELNAARRPVLAATLALPPNLGAIAVVMATPHWIIAAPLGVLLGSALAALTGTLLSRHSFAGGTTAPELVESRGEQARRIGWTLVAMSCFSVYAVVEAFWATRAADGTLAIVSYAQRLIMGIGSLVVAGPSALLAPRFAVRLRDGGPDVFLREVRRTIIIVGLVVVAVAVVLALVADPLITLAFARGQFNAADVAGVRTAFRAMLPGLCTLLVSIVLTRAIFCLPRMERAMGLLSLCWTAIYFISCGALLGLGVAGFGIGYSLAWSAYMLIAMLLLHRYAHRSN